MSEKIPMTPEQVAAKNREVAMYYKIVCTLSRNLHCSAIHAMQLLELPGSIRECGVDETEFFAKLPAMADRALEDQCTTANPRYPLVREIEEIYTKAYFGK